LAYFETVHTHATHSPRIIVLKAKVLLGLKKYPEVVNALSGIIRDDQNNTEALYVRAVALFFSGNSPAAQKHLAQALSLDPDNAAYRIIFKKVQALEKKKQAGNDAFSSGRYQEAYDIYSECLSIEPENTSVNSTLYNNRAAAAIKLGRFKDAAEDCSKTIESDPSNSKAILRRAQCYMSLENYEEAVRDYDKLHQKDPENSSYANDLRKAKLELKKAKRKDYYKILGISKDAGEGDIKSAYKKSALRWHPDKNTESEEARTKAEQMFKDVGEAYAVVSDPKKRRKYDSGEDLEEMEGGMPDVDINQIFSMFFGGGGPGGPGGGMPRGGRTSFRSGGGGFPGGGFY